MTEKKPIRKKKRKSKKHDYVNNERFFKLMCDYVTERKQAIKEEIELPRPCEEIGEIIKKIAERIATSPNFANYPFVDEMICDGIENCFMYLHNFDPEKSKYPFAYYTRIILFAFYRRIKKEKKQLYIKYKSTELFLENNDLSELTSIGNKYGSEETDAKMREYIEIYEDKNDLRKIKNKNKKGEQKSLI